MYFAKTIMSDNRALYISLPADGVGLACCGPLVVFPVCTSSVLARRPCPLPSSTRHRVCSCCREVMPPSTSCTVLAGSEWHCWNKHKYALGLQTLSPARCHGLGDDWHQNGCRSLQHSAHPSTIALCGNTTIAPCGKRYKSAMRKTLQKRYAENVTKALCGKHYNSTMQKTLQYHYA